jgi:hypothetical protein
VSDKNLRPRDKKPFSSYSPNDRLQQMSNVADEIVKIAQEVTSRKTASSSSPVEAAPNTSSSGSPKFASPTMGASPPIGSRRNLYWQFSIAIASIVAALVSVVMLREKWQPTRETPKAVVEGSVFVDCDLTFLPTVFPSEGEVHVASLSQEELRKGDSQIVVSGLSGKPGDDIPWAKPPGCETHGIPGYQCTITNDNTVSPLFEVAIPLNIQFIGPGAISGTWFLVTKRLDPGAANKRIFYIRSQAPMSAVMFVGDEGTAFKEDVQRKISIKHPRYIVDQTIALLPLLCDRKVNGGTP